MPPIIDEAVAAALPARLRKLAHKIDRLAGVARIDPPRAEREVRAAVVAALPRRGDVPGEPQDDPALPGLYPPTPTARGPPASEPRMGFDVLWVRPRRAAQISGIGLTKLYELIAAGQVESRRLGGARLISMASLLALGEEQAPQFPNGLAAARERRAAADDNRAPRHRKAPADGG